MPRPQHHPAARQGARRLLVDQRAAVHARAGARTSTTGASSAMSAGAMPTCCRISARPRTSSAARTNWHGEGGPLSVSDMEPLPICDAFIAAAEQCGYRRNPDFNGAAQEGFGYYQFTTRNGRRCSTAVGYLKPARRRRESEGRRRARSRRACCSRAGARSASNICRAARQHIAHAARSHPRGRRLQHAAADAALRARAGVAAAPARHRGRSPTCRASAPTCRITSTPAWSIAARSRSRSNDLLASKLRGLLAGLHYLLRRRGLLAMGAAYAGGFFRTNEAAATPDVQCHIMLFSGDTIAPPLHPFSGISCPLIVLRPESRGTVRIKSADPRQPPAIQPRYLSAAKDRDTMVAGLRALRRIMAAPALAPFIEAEHDPGPACASDDDLLDFVRRTRLDRLSPDLDLPHGRAIRPPWSMRGSARARLRAPAHRRCLDHAGARLRQHQCGRDHDRREGRRHDLAGRTGRASQDAQAARDARMESEVVPSFGRSFVRLPIRARIGQIGADDSIPIDVETTTLHRHALALAIVACGAPARRQ